MTKPILFLAVAALVSVGSATAAMAKSCGAYNASASQVSGDAYDPADTSGQIVVVQVQSLEASLANGCTSVGVSLATPDSSAIQLLKGAQVLSASLISSNYTGNITSDEVHLNGNARNSIVGDGSVNVNFLSVPAGQFVPAGDYVANLELRVGDAAPAPFQVIVNVAPSLRFIGDASDGVIDLSLGEVSNGAQASSTFFYNTNASLSVTARSDHLGNLQHEDGPAFGKIPYQAFLSGAELNLETPSPIVIGFSGASTQSKTLLVQVGPQDKVYSGHYSDVLTLDFTAY